MVLSTTPATSSPQSQFPKKLSFGAEIFSDHQYSIKKFRGVGAAIWNGLTPPKTPVVMRVASFSTSTPKPRAKGSSPSAPATKTAPKIGFKPPFLGAFSVFLVGGTRSEFPLLML